MKLLLNSKNYVGSQDEIRGISRMLRQYVTYKETEHGILH